MDSTKKKFKSKSFITFIIAWVFIILLFSGVVIYFSPAGRIANWTQWGFLGLNKLTWQGVHIIFSILFVVGAVFHLFFNWKVLMHYLISKMTKGIHLKRELAAATSIVFVILAASILNVYPLWTIVEWREEWKRRDSIVETTPPLPHTEDMTLTSIAALIDIPVEEMCEILRGKGYEIEDTGLPLSQLAELNNTTPEILYTEIIGEGNVTAVSQSLGEGGAGLGRMSIEERERILEQEPEHEPEHPVSQLGGSPGYGRKTVRELCIEAGIPVEQGIQNLMANGISARSNDRIRDLAAAYNIRPSAILQYLEKK
ncbi:DUF4405 domain-containing protein [candidate division KSB1 bacterium]